jgi:hypothetical protein
MRLIEPLQPLLANRDGYMCRTDDRNQSFDGTVDGSPNCPGRAVDEDFQVKELGRIRVGNSHL